MDLSFVTWSVVILTGIALCLKYLYENYMKFDRFEKCGVPHFKRVPILGDLWRPVLRIENLIYSLSRIYKSSSEHRYVGTFQMSTPTIMIRDPDLIRSIAIKDFDHFTDRVSFINKEADPLFGKNLIALQGQKWRDMRATLSPAFTGSKMRSMYILVSDCAQQMAEYLKKQISENENKEFEVRNLLIAYSNDVIASTAFGFEVNSLENRDNDFFKMGDAITNFTSFKTSLKFFGFNTMPKVMEALGISFFDASCHKFFRELVHDTMALREREGIVRPDMIHLLMQAKKGQLKYEAGNEPEEKDAGFATVAESDVGKASATKQTWTDDDLTAQAMLFFIAGFHVISTVLSFACHELAMNQDVQKRLQEEIDEFEDEERAPDYESINRMKYLDMVVSETLRKWPGAAVSDRACIRPYTLEDYNRNTYEIQKGEKILLPIYEIHHDEKYYPDPEKFDPERFSDENKKNIKPFTYLPFGVGPRNCIGSRFALMEMKSLLFHMLRQFHLEPCARTEIDLKLTRKSFVMMPENGFWISISRRKHE